MTDVLNSRDDFSGEPLGLVGRIKCDEIVVTLDGDRAVDGKTDHLVAFDLFSVGLRSLVVGVVVNRWMGCERCKSLGLDA